MLEPATIERASSIVLTKKKDGSLKRSIYYQTLNAFTVRICNLLLKTDQYINLPREASVFYTLETSSMYSQIKIVENERERTMFKIHHGLYLHVRFLFGLQNAPATI